MGNAAEHGWKISDVERLTGLSRRDIQRCCYEGKGGVGILKPQNSSWGKRLYDVHDLATLFVVASYRNRGLTLPQIKDVFDEHPSSDCLRTLLDEEIAHADDQLEKLLAQSVRAKALRVALGKDAHELLEDLFTKLTTIHLALRPEERSREELMAVPGMELLVELWLATYEKH